jgi:hypothetical protein
MKNTFPGYYKKSEDEIKGIWDNGVILFDTNVLLNLYRYSDNTRDTIIDLIKKLKEKINLPHQAALEYNRHRYEVIAEQEKAYKEFSAKIDQIQEDLQSTNKPPFLSQNVDTELNKVFEDVRKEVQENIKKYCSFLKEDPIFEILSKIFDGKISDGFTKDELNDIYKEGEERYKKKIPPGFEDEKNKEGERKYGDLILWKQVIKVASNIKKDIILVTDERKIDWWWRIKDGRNMGPRQELVEEIKTQANVNFHMYSSERFLSYGQAYLKEQIDEKALEEIQAMKIADLESIKNTDRINYLNRKRKLEKHNIELKSRYEELEDRINMYNDHISLLRDREIFSDENSASRTEHSKHLRLQLSQLEAEREKVLEEYHRSKERYFTHQIKDDDNFFRSIEDFRRFNKDN